MLLRVVPLASALALLPCVETGAQGPARRTPRAVGIDYPIVACRMVQAGNDERRAFPDVMNFSLYVGRGTDLVLIQPDGSEEVLVDAGPTGAIVDPVVSFDGRSIFYSKFEDPENYNTQRHLSRSPAHIWRYDFATRRATQLTFGERPLWQDTGRQVDPSYAQFNISPVELADGRILFLSNRDASMNTAEWLVSMRFFRMERDGSHIEPLEVSSTQGACMHPIILKDGRIVWTHFHPAGRRESNGNFPLFVANPDMSHIETFAGAHHQRAAYHFTTQLADGDVVTTVYYQSNNYGHGTLLSLPLDGNPQGNDFHPASRDNASHSVYPMNIHFRRIGEEVLTPWSYIGDLNYDAASPLMGGGEHTGKCTMPAGAPNGNMLFVWSDGPVNALQRPVSGLPNMKVAFSRTAHVGRRNDLIVIKEDPRYHYLYPKPLVPYARIFGVPRPRLIPDTPNDGSAHPVLPAGSPFATTGTSSVYNRESAWPQSFRDDWDARIMSDYSQNTAHHNVGQDSYRFADSVIFAAQVVADMTRIDTRYRTLSNRFRSHNRDQLWGILGEVPVRKTQNGQVVMDPQGNPDTSYEVRIPSGVPFHHRLLSRDGIMLTAEHTWHSTRPGERKNDCGGCHAHSRERQYLDFSRTAAARPTYAVEDFALQTPMLSEVNGQPAFVPRPERIRLVEYYRDIKPILDAKCASCHPADGSNPPNLATENAVDALAFLPNGLAGYHQATRWVRKNSAAQSLLVWKVYGRRLDGRSNATRTTDVDYSGQSMPPPGHPQLTFDEKRLIAAWVDLGCLTNLNVTGTGIGTPWDDQAYPVLTVSKPDRQRSTRPLDEIVVGVYDLHSGIDPSSLVVQFGRRVGPYAANQNLAAGLQIADGDVVRIPLSPPVWNEWNLPLTVTVRDRAGNLARREMLLQVIPWPASENRFGSDGFTLNVIGNLDSSSTPVGDLDAVSSVGSSARVLLTLPGARERGLPPGTIYSTMFTTLPLASWLPFPWALPQADGFSAPLVFVAPPHWAPILDGLGFTGPPIPAYSDPGYPGMREIEFPVQAPYLQAPGSLILVQAFAVAPTALWVSNPILQFIRP